MSKEIKTIIKGEDCYFIKDYKDNDTYRQSFSRLARKTYGFDFEDWYREGWWGDRYIPFSLVHNGEVVANISVNTLDFLIDGAHHNILQIGTVMTDEAYRNKGLSRELMDRIMEEISGKYETVYLYANDSVLEFYPKFGFKESHEYIHSRIFTKEDTKNTYRKIDSKNPKDREIITQLVKNTRPSSKISMVDNLGLIMIGLTVFMPENFYYIKDLDLAVVAEYEGDNLLLMEVYSEKEFSLDTVISTMMNKPEMTVTLGFTPFDASNYNCEVLKEEDSTFFIKGNNPLGLGRFPAMSHA